MEFSDKPQIYNEFLELMKKFKAQTIGTRSVIDAVKNMFKGHNELILGFNAFLPEGEEIELTEEEENTPPYPSNNPSGVGSGGGGGSSSSSSSSSSTDAAAGSGTMMTPNQGQGAGEAATGLQMMQQEHAISYVTTVRNRFANEPDTYRAFLRILHTYQKEKGPIKDAMEQVSILFADHPDLLMEFTHFLPNQAKERLNRATTESEGKRRQRERDEQRRQHELVPGQHQGSKSLAPLLICGGLIITGINYGAEIASFFSSYGTPILCFSAALCLEIFYHKSVFGIKVRN